MKKDEINEMITLLPTELESKLTSIQRILLSYYLLCNGKDVVKEKGYFFATNKEICNEIGITEKTLITANRKLEMLDYIDRKSGKRGMATEYKVNENIINALQKENQVESSENYTDKIHCNSDKIHCNSDKIHCNSDKIHCKNYSDTRNKNYSETSIENYSEILKANTLAINHLSELIEKLLLQNYSETRNTVNQNYSTDTDTVSDIDILNNNINNNNILNKEKDIINNIEKEVEVKDNNSINDLSNKVDVKNNSSIEVSEVKDNSTKEEITNNQESNKNNNNANTVRNAPKNTLNTSSDAITLPSKDIAFKGHIQSCKGNTSNQLDSYNMSPKEINDYLHTDTPTESKEKDNTPIATPTESKEKETFESMLVKEIATLDECETLQSLKYKVDVICGYICGYKDNNFNKDYFIQLLKEKYVAKEEEINNMKALVKEFAINFSNGFEKNINKNNTNKVENKKEKSKEEIEKMLDSFLADLKKNGTNENTSISFAYLDNYKEEISKHNLIQKYNEIKEIIDNSSTSRNTLKKPSNNTSDTITLQCNKKPLNSLESALNGKNNNTTKQEMTNNQEKKIDVKLLKRYDDCKKYVENELLKIDSITTNNDEKYERCLSIRNDITQMDIEVNERFCLLKKVEKIMDEI